MKKASSQQNNLRPIRRSRLRLFFGTCYYTSMRYLLWHSGKYRFAKQATSCLPQTYTWFVHQTPLIRQLKDVDMQYQYNKIINLKLAVQKLDGIVVHPGETFSYWKSIGKPTAKKGYANGMVLHYGTFSPGVGGGLCQLSNLLYWMTLHTPLTVTERYRHSFDVFPDAKRTQPFGSGATCVYPYRDLMIQNNTNDIFVLHVTVTDTHLQGTWESTIQPYYQYEIVEKYHQMKSEYWGGFSRHNKIFRLKKNMHGDLLEEEYITENHALMMYSPFLSEPCKPDDL